jgi:hypothetical protein
VIWDPCPPRNRSKITEEPCTVLTGSFPT